MAPLRCLGAHIAPLAIGLVLSLGSVARTAYGQVIMPPIYEMLPSGPDDRSGPRLGVAVLTAGSLTAERMNRRVAPIMTLLGWQLEHQFDAGPDDIIRPVTELVFMVGGLEQGIALPSMSWIVGMRQQNGGEGGIGALLTPAGPSLVMAGGITQVVGRYNVPVNLAVAPGRRGVSISLTTGFNERRYRGRRP